MKTILSLLLTAALTLAERPNVVIVFVDDFGWGDLQCQGNTLAKTPRLDRMAAEGVRFTQGYVASPICSPSRCGLITGQHPGRWRITSFLQTKAGNKACEMADFLDPKAPSLPRMLKEAGYATAHIGKWHLGGGRDVKDAPKFKEYGYDLGIGTYESPEPHPDITSTDWIWAKTDKVPRHERTKWMVDQALKFFQDHPKSPKFVNLWLDDTHTPFVPENQVKDQQKNYVMVMNELDLQIGRLLDNLKGTNTLVLLIGDNGAMPTFDQKRVGGLRGSKLSLYEGGIRVPFLAWWPEGIAKPMVNDSTIISTLDLVPSLVKLCEAKPPAVYTGAGEDLSKALRGESPKRSTLMFWEYGRNETSFAYPKNAKHKSPNLAVRDGDWKLLANPDGSGAELYNLKDDRNETKNVIAEQPAMAETLKSKLLAWRKTLP